MKDKTVKLIWASTDSIYPINNEKELKVFVESAIDTLKERTIEITTSHYIAGHSVVNGLLDSIIKEIKLIN